MALQAYLLDLRTVQLARIGGAVRRVACLTSLEPHRPMLEGEWTAFIAMAVEASRLIRAERLRHRRLHAAMRIVAIDAAHRAFRHLVMKRLLELRGDGQMATLALSIDRFGLAHHQLLMDLMAIGASHHVLGMAALQTAGVRRLVQMAGEAEFIGPSGGKLSRIPDVRGRGGLGVFRPRSVTGLAGPPFPALLLISAIDQMMRSFCECLGGIFMTHAACFRSHVR